MAIAPTSTLQGTPVERVHRLTQIIREGGDEAQKLRHLPHETVNVLIDEGLFRFTLPPELGGEDASSMETIEVLEAISAIDASVGWNVMIGSEINAMAAGGMPADLAKEVYLDNPRVIMCGGGGPGTVPGKAVEQPDGSFKIWGQTTFQSGCHQVEWAFMSCPIYESEDAEAPIMDEAAGMPKMKMFFVNRSLFEIVDTWDVAGLRGSGSHDVKVDGAVIEKKWLDVELMKLPALYPNPVFRIPVPLRLSYNKAAVALGVGRGALDAFSDLAQNKVPMLSPGTLRDRPVAQYRMGEAEATVQAARAYVMEAMREVEDELHAGAPHPGAETTRKARLACTFAANACMHAVDGIHNTAGTTGARMYSPLERKLRDAHGCASHRWVAHPLYETIGKLYLGHEPDVEFQGA